MRGASPTASRKRRANGARYRVRASAGTMTRAATTWLIDRTTTVAVVPSLLMGRAKEAMAPHSASARTT